MSKKAHLVVVFEIADPDDVTVEEQITAFNTNVVPATTKASNYGLVQNLILPMLDVTEGHTVRMLDYNPLEEK
jgi:hypothetical protein